jgi:4-hydroxybenzoate polyprenyltransferase
MTPNHDSSAPFSLNAAVRLLRPKQWIKNFFVFAPLVFAVRFSDETSVINALLAFAIFSVTSSATYVLNDLMDIEADKAHPVKSKKRPLAAGDISQKHGWILFTLLILLSLAGLTLLPAISLAIIGYLALTIAYSTFLKHQAVWDLFTIATGFVLRVYAGAMAIDVPVSSWMFITTFSLALFLASMKRRQELRTTGDTARKVLRTYTEASVDKFAEISATSTLIFYSFFVMSERPELVMTLPFVLFGLFRYWHLAEQDSLTESPTDAVTKDWQLLAAIVGWCVASSLALSSQFL